MTIFDFYKTMITGLGLGGGGTTSTNTVQNADPWKGQQPYLTYGFEQAKQNFQTPQSYFPNQSVVPFSPQSDMAMRLTEGRALQGSPVNFAAQDLATNTLGGNYLNGNPYLDAMYNSGVSGMTRNFGESVLPNIDSQFAGKGRYGSDLWGNQKDQAMQTFGKSLSDYATNLYGGAYENERNRQQQTMAMAPQLAAQDYTDFAQLGNVGAMTEGKAQQQLADQINRYQFYQQRPDQALQQYMGNVTGNYGSSTTGTTTGGTQANPLMNALGLGLTGYGLLSGAAAPLSMSGYSGIPLMMSAAANAAPVAAGIGASALPFFMCWVAREVYGDSNPAWLRFYDWKELKAPKWFKWLYNKHGKQFAAWIKNKPYIKNLIRKWMDTKI